jgi:hypothetical protein
MTDDRRSDGARDRRANPRGGRREDDLKKPWYMRRRLWLATASLLYVGWRRMRGFAAKRGAGDRTSGLAA